ncbi:MAG TPA: UDP-N-acetylmuramoyl-L-alanine--D-glutamate ligase [Candidatus Saccharimonadales bacterium]|nr:UDP-N-acetylmuramoyl-L-alanine--D-glutamate ligase [Candidatus Saccharimonadales bacterium]
MAKTVAIVGFAVEGEAALHYFQQAGYEVTVCDQDVHKQIPAGVASQLGSDYLANLDRFDVVFRSAGIHPDIILSKNPAIAQKLTTTMNEFLQVCPTKNVIGITGTKGKGTTSTLTAKMLEAAGKKVFLGGNIGLSPFSFLSEITADSWVVLELSSFQLSDIHHSPHIAVCLMVVPEHLNWHSDMQDYTAAKAQLFAHQTEQDIAIYFDGSEESKRIASASPGQKLPFFAPPGAFVQDDEIVIDGQHVCKTSDIKLLGKHNWQNACAAVTAVWQITQSVEAMRSVLTSFTGLPHHLEFLRTLDDVDYYDDSFGTTPETAIVALQAFTKPKVIILGGSSKGVPFNELAKAVTANNVRQAIVIGDTAPDITEALTAQGFTNITQGGSTMHDIVATARKAAQPGDIILLSTGCASFGLFKNYKDRGQQFQAEVSALA